jgi:hypothetical protein
LCSPESSAKKATKQTPLLHPLHIITDINEPEDAALSHPAMLVERQNLQPCGSVCPSYRLSAHPVLYGIRITFPNGVKMSVRKADSYGIYSLVYGM